MKKEVKVNNKTVSHENEVPNKVYSAQISYEADNESKNKKVTLEPIEIGDTLVESINNMRRVNATECTLTFEKCGSLLNYDMIITLRSPNWVKPSLFQRLKVWLSSLSR